MTTGTIPSDTFQSKSAVTETLPHATTSRTSRFHESLQWALTTAVVVAITIWAYWGVWRCEFVNFDDGTYVFDNPNVKQGLTAENVRWAWTTFRASNWHPLTWLSLQLDASLFGSQPWSVHATNLALHIINAVLVLWFGRRLFTSLWPAAFVALCFAIHPQHVESVAWISERKDVLSTFFGLLALLAYGRYADRPSVARYLVLLVAFALSLLAKPMLVTLPCLLLLMDWWPLRRAASSEAGEAARPAHAWLRLISEKIPLALLTLASCTLTMSAQHSGGALRTLDDLGLADRCANIVDGYRFYLAKFVWPRGLIAFYPPENGYPAWATLCWGLGGLIFTAMLFKLRRRAPNLLYGWLWFLGTLVPVIGLVQVGAQAYADRYSYFPHIGLSIALAAATYGLARASAALRTPIVGLACAAVVACAFLTREQTTYWQDSHSLWEHALSVTPDNFCAHRHMADLLANDDRLDEAIAHASIAAVEWPYQISYVQLANLFLRAERYDEAIEQFRRAVADEPADADSHLMLGNLLLQQHRPREAAEQFEEALAWRGGWGDALNGLGAALAMQGDNAAALKNFSAAVESDPANGTYHNNVGQLLAKMGDTRRALAALDRAVEVDPRNAQAWNHRGNLLASLDRWPEAASAYQTAIEENGNLADYRFNLAVALNECGEAQRARRQYEAALQLDPGWPQRAAEQAWRLASSADPSRRDGAKALRLARQVCLQCENPTYASLDLLACAYAELGRFEEALDAARKAESLALEEGNGRFAEEIVQRIYLYGNGTPYRGLTNRQK